jgi:hypothetical protein
VPIGDSGVQTIVVPAKCVPVTPKVRDDESPIYRNLHCIVENGGRHMPTYRNRRESATFIDILKTSAVKSGDCDCTGERVIYPDGSAGPYQYIWTITSLGSFPIRWIAALLTNHRTRTASLAVSPARSPGLPLQVKLS